MEQRYDIEKMERLKEHVGYISLKVEEINRESQEIVNKIASEKTPKAVSMISQLVSDNIFNYLEVLRENSVILENRLLDMKELVVEVDDDIGKAIENTTKGELNG